MGDPMTGMYNLICGAPGLFNPTAPLGGVNCQTMVHGMGMNLQDLNNDNMMDASLCDTKLSDMNAALADPNNPGMTVKEGLTYMMVDCCEGSTMPYSGLCGPLFEPHNTFCEDVTMFDAKKKLGEHSFHCLGDELLSEAECKYTDSSGKQWVAWKGDVQAPEENCDVGHTESEMGDNVDRAKLQEICEGMTTQQVQTTWKEGTCMDMNHWMLRQIKAVNATGSQQGFACVPDMKENYQAFDCCMGGKTWADHCPNDDHGKDESMPDEGTHECNMPTRVSTLDLQQARAHGYSPKLCK